MVDYIRIGDYIPASEIGSKEKLEKIRTALRNIGYRVSENYGTDLETINDRGALTVDEDGDAIAMEYEDAEGTRRTAYEALKWHPTIISYERAQRAILGGEDAGNSDSVAAANIKSHIADSISEAVNHGYTMTARKLLDIYDKVE